MILEYVYPVGSVYISLTDSRNPSDILGFGTWEALPAGYGLVAQGTATAEDGSTLKFTVGQKSGEFKHQITVKELPNIRGTISNISAQDENVGVSATGVFSSYSAGAAGRPETSKYDAKADSVELVFGSDQYHSNVSPAIAAYCWHRIS